MWRLAKQSGTKDMAAKVIIFGHSFVKRLKFFIQSQDEYDNLGLSPLSYNVACLGAGGLKLSDRRRMHAKDRSLQNSDLVILELGSNDLCDPNYHPEDFARHLIAHAKYLTTGLGVRTVVICQIIKRRTEPYVGYNDRVVAANQSLVSLIDTCLDPIVFWRHRGVWNSSSDIYAADGIHLSNDVGYKKYLRSMRDCVIRVSNWFS